MEILSVITYNELLNPIIETILNKHGDHLMPELVPGSSRGTMLKNDIDVETVKNNPTWRNWYLFLAKKGFWDDGERLVNIDNDDWQIRYALAWSFSDKKVACDLNVTADMFSRDSFLCFPEAMAHIIHGGILDCTVNWNQTDYLGVWVALDYGEHYSDRNTDGVSMFYWYGQLDRNGILKGKLELRKNDRHSY